MNPDTTPQIYKIYNPESMAERAVTSVFLKNNSQHIKNLLSNAEQTSQRVILPDIILDLVYSAGQVMDKPNLGPPSVCYINKSRTGLLSHEYDADSTHGATLVSKLLWVERNSSLGASEDTLTADVFFVALAPREQASLKPENLRVGWIQDSNGDMNTFKIVQDIGIDPLHCSPQESATKLFKAYPLGVTQESELVHDVERFIAFNP